MILLLHWLAVSSALAVNPNLSATLPSVSEIRSARDNLIVISLKDKTLKFIDAGKLIKQYPIGIGKPKTPTPVGRGFIRSKGKMVFFQSKGKKLPYLRLKNGQWIKMPNKKILGFGISIPGHDPFEYYIHSTTNDDAINAAVSNGCVRMKILDMLELYPLAPVGTRIIIKR